MRRPKKGKYPAKIKYPAKPKTKKGKGKISQPKGGIKTETQLSAYNQKKKKRAAENAKIEAENQKRLRAYNAECKQIDKKNAAARKKVDDKYNAEMKKYNDFLKRVAKAKNA